MKFETLNGYVPAVLVTLNESESVFAEHGIMLYKDQSVTVGRRSIGGNFLEKMERKGLGDIPFIVAEFKGPGSVAFSRDGKGEIRDIEIPAGVTMDVAEGSLLCATDSIKYDMYYIKGTMRLGRMVGRWMDRLTGPGTAVIHGYGNIISFNLDNGESIVVDYGALLMKHSTVRERTFNQPLGHGLMGHVESFEVLELTGPGSIMLQSIDPHNETI